MILHFIGFRSFLHLHQVWHPQLWKWLKLKVDKSWHLENRVNFRASTFPTFLSILWIFSADSSCSFKLSGLGYLPPQLLNLLSLFTLFTWLYFFKPTLMGLKLAIARPGTCVVSCYLCLCYRCAVDVHCATHCWAQLLQCYRTYSIYSSILV